MAFVNGYRGTAQRPPLARKPVARCSASVQMHNATVECAFCHLLQERIVRETALATLVWDAFPVSPGHALAIPKRHVGSWFETSTAERTELLTLIDEARLEACSRFHPDAFNIGINDGAAAGQTVPHLHVHLIPRYAGDVQDPRGGIRWLLPKQADYWSQR